MDKEIQTMNVLKHSRRLQQNMEKVYEAVCLFVSTVDLRKLKIIDKSNVKMYSLRWDCSMFFYHQFESCYIIGSKCVACSNQMLSSTTFVRHFKGRLSLIIIHSLTCNAKYLL